MTYLELVNFALQEAGVKMQPLTSATFASPTGSEMYTKFKTWVASEWEKLQIESDELEFMQGKATITINPRITYFNGNRATAPEADSIFQGADTDTSITVISTDTDGGTWLGGDAYGTIDFTTLGTGSIKLNELFDETDPGSGSSIFQIKDYGRYDFSDDVSDLAEINHNSFLIQSSDGDSSVSARPLVYMPWGVWVRKHETAEGYRGTPMYITTTPDGRYDLWPRPDTEYVLSFDYNKGIQTLSAHDDTPTGIPAMYHKLIAWKAVESYANYDNQNTLWSKAHREVEFYKSRMDKRQMPVVTFGPSKF